MRAVPWIVAAMLAAGCSSNQGTSSGTGIVPGTSTGDTDLIIFATLSPEDLSSDAWPSDCNEDGIIEQLIHSDLGELTITVQDPFGRYPLGSQGVLFDSYTVQFIPVTALGPRLSPRTHGLSIPIRLVGGSGTATVSIVLVELDTTKDQFRRGNPDRFPFSYTLRVTVRGRDFINQEPVSATVSAQIELGDFCESGA